MALIVSHNKSKSVISVAVLCAAATFAPIPKAEAASIDMVAFLGVNLGTVVPDWSDFEPGGPQEGETPTGDLEIETAGLDSSNSATARATVSTASGPGPSKVGEFARVGVRYSNNANHPFDIFDIFFDFNVSGLLVFNDAFEEPAIDGVSAAGFVRNDGGAGPGTGSLITMAGSDYPAPRANLSEFQLDAFTATVGNLRLEVGESATFVIDLEARAATVPLPASVTMMLLACGALAGASRVRRT